jgi:serine/threonine-protein kinase
MADVRLPRVVAGRYRPVRIVGEGGMGTVYEVEHLHTAQRLALKALANRGGALLTRWRREARALSRIASEHVVKVIDAGLAPELDGAPFLVMELLDGTDLERATHDAPVAPDQVVGWLRQVAHGLDDAHRAGVIHRDLKPANLFLARGGGGAPVLKILDFGVSKLLAESSADTGSKELVGSPIYMAPEQTEGGGGAITARTDLFALGLVAHRLLAGRVYWRRGTLSHVLSQLLVEPMAPPSQRGSKLGAAFDAWFLRACDRDPRARFASAAEQIEALATALGVAAPVVTPALAAAATPPRRARWLLAAAVAIAAVAGVAAGGVVRSSHRVAADQPPPAATASPEPRPARAPEDRREAHPPRQNPRREPRRARVPARDPLEGQF